MGKGGWVGEDIKGEIKESSHHFKNTVENHLNIPTLVILYHYFFPHCFQTYIYIVCVCIYIYIVCVYICVCVCVCVCVCSLDISLAVSKVTESQLVNFQCCGFLLLGYYFTYAS